MNSLNSRPVSIPVFLIAQAVHSIIAAIIVGFAWKWALDLDEVKMPIIIFSLIYIPIFSIYAYGGLSGGRLLQGEVSTMVSLGRTTLSIILCVIALITFFFNK